MTQIAPLSPSYALASAAFLDATRTAGARVESFVHPLRGPQGEELAVDVAELGPVDAPTVVVVVSATHGVEGYCGSALQTHWLAHHSSPDARVPRPDDVRIVFVHAFNPYGFAWVRRVNEDNVDLNRNFIEWGEPPPANDDYARLADLLVPREWSHDEQARTTAELFGVVEEWGFPKLQAVISGGQYTHPDGVFFGGAGPVWSHRWLREWATGAFDAAHRVVVIDLHTGLGPWGVGELISHASRDDPAFRRADALWGDVTSMVDGDSVSAALQGDWLGIVDDLLPHAEVTAVALEYGTVDPITVLQALRADAWLHAHGDPRAPEAHDIRAQVRAAFADDDAAWIARCWDRFHEVIDAALAPLVT